MTSNCRRTPPLLNAKILQMDPLTQWWTLDDVVCVALRSVSRSPVLTIGGVLDHRAAGPCRRALEAALRARPRRLVLDMASVSATEGCALTLLDAMRRTAAWHGADVWLSAVPEPVRVGLSRTGLLGQFQVARTTTRAIEEIDRLDRALPRTA